MRRKILLPTDFSQNAWHAINFATMLYKNEDCDFYILNVFSATGNLVKSLVNLEPGSNLYETKKIDSEKSLAKVLEKIILRDESNEKHDFKTISTFNNTIETIKDIVEQKDIEIIIMGTKGQTYSRITPFGSTAIYVMEKVRNCPVLVIPKNAKKVLPKEIVFPTSYKTHYKRRELNYLTGIAKKCDATIAVLHISEENELDENQLAHQDMLKVIFEEVKYSFHTLSYNSVQAAVNNFVEIRESDMVAFINKKHTFFGSIFTDAMVKEISIDLNVPILAMHDLRN